MDSLKKSWAVVGGGMMGMTIALRLRQAGHSVTLYERATELGGLAASWTLPDGVVWDKHYHVILMSDTSTIGILKELGLEPKWGETRTGCYTDGELYSVSNTVEFLRFPPLRWIDKARLAWTILYGSRIKDWRALERQTVEAWLRRHSGNRTFEKFWLPLLRSKLGDNYQITAASFIWATIQRLYAARRTGLKKEMFGFVPGGYARVIGEFGRRLGDLGVDVRLGSQVISIAGEDGRVSVVTQHGLESYDEAVVTTAPPIAAKLVHGLTSRESSSMEAVQYQGIVCASMVTTKPLGGFYTTNITDVGFPFTGVIEMTTLVPREHFNGNHLTYLPKYTTADDEIHSWSDEKVESEFLNAVERMYPDFRRESVLGFQISRVRYVMPVPVVGYSSTLPPIHTSIPGVHLLSSANIVNGTLNVNETVDLAETRVADLMAHGDKRNAIGVAR